MTETNTHFNDVQICRDDPPYIKWKYVREKTEVVQTLHKVM